MDIISQINKTLEFDRNNASSLASINSGMLLIMCVLLITCIVLIIVCKKYIKIIAAIGGIIVIIFSITLLTPIIDENK